MIAMTVILVVVLVLWRSAERHHAQSRNVLDQAEALVSLAAQYRQCGDDAYRDADELIRNARCRIQEWSA